ncbi:hypothetical protein ASG87_11800 [Frateuria sp. Soil773]|nr:hypothetical protein ASG87_11800 [Frateuria sp. Soil773]
MCLLLLDSNLVFFYLGLQLFDFIIRRGHCLELGDDRERSARHGILGIIAAVVGLQRHIVQAALDKCFVDQPELMFLNLDKKQVILMPGPAKAIGFL